MPSNLSVFSRQLVRLQSNEPSVTGMGKVQPHLRFGFEARSTVEKMEVEFFHVISKLRVGDEVLGAAVNTDYLGQPLQTWEYQFVVEIPVSLRALDFIERQFRGHNLVLQLEMTGVLRIKDSGTVGSFPQFPKDQQNLVPLDKVTVAVQVPRSSWINNVLTPIGYGDYIVAEIPRPALPNPADWQTAMDHLVEADQNFRNANDPGVLQECYATFESLPGAPKNIFDKVSDPAKQKQLNELMKVAKDYFQAGRHVSKSGPQPGEFAANRYDAEFSLGMSKLFLAYIARVLAAQP